MQETLDNKLETVNKELSRIEQNTSETNQLLARMDERTKESDGGTVIPPAFDDDAGAGGDDIEESDTPDFTDPSIEHVPDENYRTEFEGQTVPRTEWGYMNGLFERMGATLADTNDEDDGDDNGNGNAAERTPKGYE